MVLKELMVSFLDFYLPVRVEVWTHENGILKKLNSYRLKAHEHDFTSIPEDIWNMKVSDICLYCDAFVIGIQLDEQEKTRW